MLGKLNLAGLSALLVPIAMMMPVAAAEPAAAQLSLPSDAEIRQILVDRLDVAKQGVGIVVGVIDAKGKRVISYGALNQGDARPLNGDTVFEIGSITKVFTSLVLADMVQHNEVKLDDAISTYLPSTVTVPARDGKQITLVDLATHSSGLPRLPTNMRPADSNNPYADYTVDQLYAFLSGYTLPRAIGAQYEYSNLGGGLLGHVLSLRAHSDYETLVRERITKPLGMKDTAIKLTPEMSAHMAVGHDQALRPVKNWDLPTLAGAGALRSTANDLLKFLAAELGYTASPLKASMATQLSVKRPAGPGMEVALAWHVLKAPKGTAIWHNGGTGGYRTYIGYNPETRVGVAVLSNTSTQRGVDDIGTHLLVGTALAQLSAPRTHTEVALDLKAKQALVGKYELAPTFSIAITLEGEQLFEQATGQGRAAIFPESATEAFLKVVEAQISFKLGPDGKAESMVLHQNGRDTPGKRVGD